MKLKRKSKAIILLRGLLEGYVVVKNGNKYRFSDDNYLCQEVISEDTKTGEKKIVLLKISLGVELKAFIEWANSFTDDEIIINTANFVLNDLQRNKC